MSYQLSATLREEATVALKEHFYEQTSEAHLYLDEQQPKFAGFTARKGSYPIPDALPWLRTAMLEAVMPDGSVCSRTLRAHLKAHVRNMTAHTGPTGLGLELKKTLRGLGLVWRYYDIPANDESDDAAHYAEVTGYALARALGIDLFEYVEANWDEAVMEVV